MDYKWVYICHFYGKNPEKSMELVRKICKKIKDENDGFVFPVAPQIYLGNFSSDEKDRDLVMSWCLSMIGKCSEVWVYGDELTSGMVEEIIFSVINGITVRCMNPILRDEIDKLIKSSKRIREMS